jgi:hypothetical protein
MLDLIETLNNMIIQLDGGFKRARKGINKKVKENFPLLAFWSMGLGIKCLFLA